MLDGGPRAVRFGQIECRRQALTADRPAAGDVFDNASAASTMAPNV